MREYDAMEQAQYCVFRFRCPEAEAVSLIGSFNDWSTTANPMTRQEDGVWEAHLSLPPGQHSYCYFVIEVRRERGNQALLTSLFNAGSNLRVPGMEHSGSALLN